MMCDKTPRRITYEVTQEELFHVIEVIAKAKNEITTSSGKLAIANARVLLNEAMAYIDFMRK